MKLITEFGFFKKSWAPMLIVYTLVPQLRCVERRGIAVAKWKRGAAAARTTSTAY